MWAVIMLVYFIALPVSCPSNFSMFQVLIFCFFPGDLSSRCWKKEFCGIIYDNAVSFMWVRPFHQTRSNRGLWSIQSLHLQEVWHRSEWQAEPHLRWMWSNVPFLLHWAYCQGDPNSKLVLFCLSYKQEGIIWTYLCPYPFTQLAPELCSLWSIRIFRNKRRKWEWKQDRDD